MNYISTRGGDEKYTSPGAIKEGMAKNRGLLVPESIPSFTNEELSSMVGMPYNEIAAKILHSLLDDFSYNELKDYANEAYSEEKFGQDPAPLLQLNEYNDSYYILELWHGPTCAFKDIALQMLPRLMSAAVKKQGEPSDVCVLTATSGDTGKAALEGFRDVDNSHIAVFFPLDGVSDMQKMQMITQEGSNCHVIAVKGCFDDTQKGVKDIFADDKIENEFARKNIFMSSANSINWGRLAPQIVYYFHSYFTLLSREKISLGEKINFVVPTGNFGNILSAWYAMKMGLPVNKLICASNKNRVLSDFLRSGIYDSKRQFFRTNSPSMDILVSSNLERLLFEVSGRDSEKVKQWMENLESSGKYTVDPKTLHRLQEILVGGFADDRGTIKTIRSIYDRYDHCVDTHTAVGFNVYERYLSRSKDETKTVFISTASPFKFPRDVSDGIFGEGYSKGRSVDVLLKELSQEIGIEIPPSIFELKEKPVLHEKIIEKEEMKETVLDIVSKSR